MDEAGEKAAAEAEKPTVHSSPDRPKIPPPSPQQPSTCKHELEKINTLISRLEKLVGGLEGGPPSLPYAGDIPPELDGGPTNTDVYVRYGAHLTRVPVNQLEVAYGLSFAGHAKYGL